MPPLVRASESSSAGRGVNPLPRPHPHYSKPAGTPRPTRVSAIFVRGAPPHTQFTDITYQISGSVTTDVNTLIALDIQTMTQPAQGQTGTTRTTHMRFTKVAQSAHGLGSGGYTSVSFQAFGAQTQFHVPLISDVIVTSKSTASYISTDWPNSGSAQAYITFQR